MWSRLTILLTLWLWSLTHSLNVHIRAVEVGFVVDDGHRWYELCWSARLVSSYIVSICTIRSNKAKQLLRVFHSIVTWTVDRLKLSIVGCCVFSHYGEYACVCAHCIINRCADSRCVREYPWQQWRCVCIQRQRPSASASAHEAGAQQRIPLDASIHMMSTSGV